jgi:hypothetical protein
MKAAFGGLFLFMRGIHVGDAEIVEERGTFFILVVDKDGQPVPKAKVFCQYENDVANEMEHTDSDGRAVFPIYGSQGNHTPIISITINDIGVYRDRYHPMIGETQSFMV